MYQEEKQFVIRFSIEAQFPDQYEGEEDNHAWLRDWEVRIKPEILKELFAALRQDPLWVARIRNRGMAPTDEIEISLSREFSANTLGNGQTCS